MQLAGHQLDCPVLESNNIERVVLYVLFDSVRELNGPSDVFKLYYHWFYKYFVLVSVNEKIDQITIEKTDKKTCPGLLGSGVLV